MSLMLLVAAAVILTACSDAGSTRRTILDRQGTIRGLSTEAVMVKVDDGKLIRIVIGQSGLDVYLELAINGQQIGRYESATGRYGEDCAEVKIAQAGTLAITIGSLRFPGVIGNYQLNVSEVANSDEADEQYTRASRVDVPLAPAERIRTFMRAAEMYGGKSRAREEGLASLAALNLLIETASDAKLAVTNGERAVKSLRDAGDQLLLASAINALAVAEGEAKQTDRMAAHFDEARRIYDAQGSRIGIAEVRLFEGVARYTGEDSEQLLGTFLALGVECAELHESVCQALALMDAAIMYRNRADYHASFDAFYSALRLVDRNADSAVTAQIDDNLAFTLRMIGDFDGAIFHHERAIEGFSGFGECSGVSRSLYGLGYSLLGIGANDQAMRFYKLALERSCAVAAVARTVPESPEVGRTAKELCAQAASLEKLDDDDRAVASWAAWDLGNFARSVSDPDGALACHEIGARLATTENYRLGTRLESVRDLVELARVSEAKALYAQVEPKLAKSHPWYRTQGMEIHAQILAASGKIADAIQGYQVAGAAYQEVGNFEGVFSALSRRASLGLSNGDSRAESFFADADAALENVRLLSLDPAYSASLFESGRRVYEEWVSSVLTRERGAPNEDRTVTALAISERSRGRLLAQLAKASHVGEEARAARRRSVAAGTVAILESAEAGRPLGTGGAIESSEETSARLNRELGLDATRFDGKARAAFVTILDKYRQHLDDQTTVVEYLLGDRQCYVWVIRKDGVFRAELGPAQPIRAATEELGGALATDQKDADEVLGKLYDLVWRPIQHYVHGSKIEIVPDDVLHALPFAALWDRGSRKYLIESAAIGYLPSIQFAVTRGAETGGGAHSRETLLVGDPVYELQDAQERCAAGAKALDSGSHVTTLRRIPASWREIDSIEAIIKDEATRPVVLIGCAATRARILAAQQGNFRFVHFATHAMADRVVPQRSAIYLSEWNQDGLAVPGVLTASDLLEHPFQAELVVLSGCSTAGGRQFSGEGSLGLSFSLMAGGAREVISTLWPVADAASVVAMTRMYEGLIVKKDESSSALRSAQLEMLAGKRWSHPRHWAAYSLLGT